MKNLELEIREKKRIGMKLSKKEEQIYQYACDYIKNYELCDMGNPKYNTEETYEDFEQNEIMYNAMITIKTFCDGLKRGDKFFKQSTNEELMSLLQITQALLHDDLILQPTQLNGIGG